MAFPQNIRKWRLHNNRACSKCRSRVIVSEYPGITPPVSDKFRQRNRIVSGLSDITLVIEAEYRSGTSITANYAKAQSKIVCCIPGSLENSRSIGTNNLIKQGANLVASPNEIIEILENNELNTKEKITKKNNTIHKKIEKQPKKQIHKEYKEVFNIIKEKSTNINTICKITNKNINEIGAILTMLEIEGLIESKPGNMFKIKED